MKETAEAVQRLLFAEPGAQVYAVLDGASVPGLLAKLGQYQPQYECLYRGELEPDLAEAAPYLVKLEEKGGLGEWILEQGWGNHWGVFARTAADLAALRRHLRTLMIVHDSAGKPMYFRYYDPRVLRTFLPTCSAAEVGEFFGPIQSFVLEGEDPGTMVKFSVTGGALAKREERLAPVSKQG